VNLASVETPNRAVNQIPARAEAWLDLRFPAEDADLSGRTAPEIAEYLRRFCEPGVTVDVDRVEPPQQADHELSEIKELRRAARGQGYPGEFLYKHGGSDASYYSGRGIAAVAFGIGGSGQHGPDEYAEITTIVPYYRALKEFLEGLRSNTDE
jgi:succinyl-diaminopimelate desuccinylase